MKVIMVTPYFYPKIGGMENYAYNVSKGLKEEYGWEVVVVTSNHKEKKYKEENIDGMKIYRLAPCFKISNTPINPLWYFQIKKIIKKEKPDIINGYSPVPFIADIACRVAKEINTPFVLTYHAATLYKRNNFIANSIIFTYNSLLGNRTFNKSNKIIVVNDFIKKSLNFKLKNKIKLVTNAINKSEIINKPRLINENNLIFISSLDKTHSWKGLENIINAIKIYVKKYGLSVKLNIIGDGDKKDYYKALVKSRGLEKYIRFNGTKTGSEKNNLLLKSRILVTYPSTSNDAFPTVFLEAWAKGLPIISSNIGAIPFILTHKKNGFLVEPNNPQKLADAIFELFNNKKLIKKLSYNGLKFIQEFIWNKTVKQTTEVYKEVLK